MKGWVSIHRQLMESAVWQDPFYLKLWMYCLLKSSHKEHEQLIGNQVEKLKPGQFITGRKSLTEDLNKGMKPEQKLSEKSWERYLKNLEKWQMLTIKTTNKYSVITVAKWNDYQETDQQLTNNCPTSDQQLTTNNNGNKGNKKDSCQKFKYESSDMELAQLLFNYIQDNSEKAYHLKNSNIESWANTIRLMRTQDKRTHEQIKYLIDWTQKHEFWKTVILSPSNLREKFNQLIIKVKAEKEKKVTHLEPSRESKRNNEHIEKMKKLHGG